MKIDERLVRFERKLGKKIEGLARRKGTRPEPFELIPAILDDVEEHIEPTGGAGRTFPYDRLVVHVAVESGRAAAARAVFAHEPPLAERIRERLLQARAEPQPGLKVLLKVVEGPSPKAWRGRSFTIDYQQQVPGDRRRTAPSSGAPSVRLVVLCGQTGRRTHELRLQRIEIGRMDTVVDRTRRTVRRNHLAFLDQEDEVNASVSRAHAHLEYQEDERGFRLFDDDSSQGTRVLRDGRSHDVPSRGSRGVKLRHGDELQFGQARVQFLTEW